ncbi:hypothetical protein PV08_10424 [Exophiala spinifera]|uniref:CST complex subunit Ten1 n=1 Tax=Exophiala spinifera TaxID=91928 RepID=A0A0D2BID7_9EURO|nr:uncharacterized protein PV08_10424 [Exophiala spinifera]KIW11124.1 hypothetical protein PV08_10424 [Exophiala spinifera]
MNESSTNGPVASVLVFLHEIASLPPETKVRLLGCVVDYDMVKGQLILEHAYPKHILPTPRVSVDVNLSLETVDSSVLRTGAWVNIIGYTRITGLKSRRSKAHLHQSRDRDELPAMQAILIWPTRVLRIEDYEITLEEQRSIARQSKSLRK